MVTIRRALLSCYDKTGLDVFAKALADCGVELVASGGTADFLRQRGLRLRTVEEFAGLPAQLDGRVKTLHPKIHAGILARRDDPAHIQAVGASGLIDLVAVSLYPFRETAQRLGVSLAEMVEQIDIGGVTLLRSAAKNFAHVAAVCEPRQYPVVGSALQRERGTLPESLTRQLAATAFEMTSAYDAWIAGYVRASISAAGPSAPEPGGESALAIAAPDAASVSVRRLQPLRYGENPHQRGAWYVPVDAPSWGLGTVRQLQGKELSYNNLLDLDAALRCLLDFGEPACAIIKHHSLCGMGTAASAQEAHARAHACDAESAFGGVVGVNRTVDRPLAERLTSTFLEVVMAPAIDPTAIEVFGQKPNLRVLTLEWPTIIPPAPEWRQLLGSWLLQEPDARFPELEALQAVTRRAPTARERDDLIVAWKVAKHVTSNGIVLVSDRSTVGIGQGQPSRVGSVRVAIEKAGARSRGAVAGSDGFFPFPDNVELLAASGVTAIIQPGGSIRDREVIAAADAAGLAMLVTGARHFRH